MADDGRTQAADFGQQAVDTVVNLARAGSSFSTRSTQAPKNKVTKSGRSEADKLANKRAQAAKKKAAAKKAAAKKSKARKPNKANVRKSNKKPVKKAGKKGRGSSGRGINPLTGGEP